MGAVMKIDQASALITETQSQFEEVAQNILLFRREYQFAMQALGNNDYLLGIALQHPQSLKNAIVNVGAIGLSLNPAESLAYLVPMDGKVQLQVSYIGFIKLGVMDGGIKWAHAEIVRKNDIFVYNGVGVKPTHQFNPFDNSRGDVIGTYCVAETHDGSFLTRMMSREECLAIRDRSKMWQKKPNSGPWQTDENEMMKKTVIKQARKTWPKGASSRLDKAIEIVNEFEGIDFDAERNNSQKKISAASDLLNNTLGAPTDPKVKELIDKITATCGIICKGQTKEEKQKFIIKELEVSSFAELYKKDIDHLTELDAYLLGKATSNDDQSSENTISVEPVGDQKMLDDYNKMVSGIKK